MRGTREAWRKEESRCQHRAENILQVLKRRGRAEEVKVELHQHLAIETISYWLRFNQEKDHPNAINTNNTVQHGTALLCSTCGMMSRVHLSLLLGM